MNIRAIVKWSLGVIVLAAVLAGASLAATRFFTPPHTEIATIAARRGEFVVVTHTRGTLRAVKSSMVIVPNVGGTLMITEMKPSGAEVHKDEVAMTFDRE